MKVEMTKAAITAARAEVQGARAKALEEAASVCDAEAASLWVDSDNELVSQEARYERANEARVVDRCASGIRALATPPAAPEVAAEPPQPTADAPRKQPTVTELEAILRGEGGPWRVEMQPDGQIRAVPLAPADAPREYACASCEDTHRRVRGAAPLMCTSCPVPCEECRGEVRSVTVCYQQHPDWR